ncbi:MAG: endolytic transglycosylase MltG [Thermodesulforhabdaceae bacterium]
MKVILRGIIWLVVVLLTTLPVVVNLVTIPIFFWAHEPIPIKGGNFIQKNKKECQPENCLYINIPQGTGVFDVVNLLVEKGVESDPYRPLALVFFMKWHNLLKSGEYAFHFPMNHIDVWKKIVRGDVVRHFVTVVEGATIFDVAEALDRSGIAKKDDVIKLAKDRNFVESLGFHDAPSLEGYLFPATYDFTKKDTADTALKRMAREFKKRFKPEWLQRAKDMNLSLHQIVTLASMVEKEAVKDEERAVIAAVFFNRLKIGMPLQSDPTAVYDLENFKGPVLKSHLARPSPYNTYLIKGFPPGPICNPGIASIKAVLYPADVTYLYFVSDRQGGHRFSTTYEDHLKAIREIAAEINQNPGSKN